MPVLRLFGPARVAAGTARSDVAGRSVDAVLADAVVRFGPAFADVLAASRVWVNGEPVRPGHELTPDDEVAVLPPVSGG